MSGMMEHTAPANSNSCDTAPSGRQTDRAMGTTG
jgi:hypothetical protein